MFWNFKTWPQTLAQYWPCLSWGLFSKELEQLPHPPAWRTSTPGRRSPSTISRTSGSRTKLSLRSWSGASAHRGENSSTSYRIRWSRPSSTREWLLFTSFSLSLCQVCLVLGHCYVAWWHRLHFLSVIKVLNSDYFTLRIIDDNLSGLSMDWPSLSDILKAVLGEMSRRGNNPVNSLVGLRSTIDDWDLLRQILGQVGGIEINFATG